jgi:hypothetical protein
MNVRNTQHAGRVLDHLSAQWPVGTAPTVVDAAVETKRQHGELITMNRRLTMALTSAAMLITDQEAQTIAIDLLRESRALLKRCGGK